MAAGEPQQDPSVIVSHLDIVYRVYGARPKDEEPEDETTAFRRLVEGSRGVGAIHEVHAVRDVSFVARTGEAIGVVGRNGSGKSTLLRAVAGLLPPTSGQVWTSGTPSLLGVNAALVKKLSGAKNIEIGCLAMGMSKAEVQERYADIVALADIGEAIHLPMSTYSSGMGARLRFAISTATRPDVLIVDEALATGDAGFKARSQERIKELTSGAGTFFLVSHSASSVRAMCTRALWMEAGRLIADGPVDDVLAAYEATTRPRKKKGKAEPAEPRYPNVHQIGTPYVATAAARISALVTRPNLPVVFLSSRKDPTGALAATPNAALLGGPVLFSSPGQLPPATAVELSRVNPGRVEILTGTAKIKPDVAQDLEESGIEAVIRPEGNRLGQLAGMAAQTVPDGAGGFLVLSDHENHNVVAATLRALRLGAPLLMLRPSDSRLPTASTRELERIRPDEVDIYCDTDAPEDALDEAVRALGVARVVRTQVDPLTSAVEASRLRFPGGSRSALLCSVSSVAEMVVGIWSSWSQSQPLLLFSGAAVDPAVGDELRRLGVEQVTVLDAETPAPEPVLASISAVLRGE